MRYRSSFRAFALLIAAAASPDVSAQTPCGTWRAGFGAPGPDQPFLDFATFDDGAGPALYACGEFDAIGGAPMRGVVRWNGTRWSQVGAGLEDVSALTVFDDGSGPRLVAGGRFTVQGGAVADYVASWNGQQWTPMPGLATPATYAADVRDLVAFDDGTGPALYLSGRLRVLATSVDADLVRWRNGAWTSADAGLVPANYTGPLAVFDSGTGRALYLGSGGYGPVLLRWNGSAWSDALPGFTQAYVHALLPSDVGGTRALYVGGLLISAPQPHFDGIARFDGTSLTLLGSGLSTGSIGYGAVGALTVHDFGSGPRVVAGGAFDGAGGVRSRGLASWNGASWEPIPTRFDDLYGVPSALASFDDGAPSLFVSGGFAAVGGGVAAWAARLRQGVWNRFADGDGMTAWAPTSPVAVISALRVVEVGGERCLVAGGGFRAAGDCRTSNVARFDGASWHALGSTTWPSAVLALADGDLGSGHRIFAGGDLDGGAPYTSVRAFDGVVWTSVGQLLGEVRALAVHDDGGGPALYAAGELIGGGVQRWNGATWQRVGSDSFSQGEGYDLCVHDAGTGPELYASARPGRVARWDGTSWIQVGPGSLLFHGQAQSRLLSFDDGSGPRLVLGGPIVLSRGSAQLAVWDGVTWTAIVTNGIVSALTTLHDGTAPRLCVVRWVGAPLGTRVSKRVGDQWVDLAVLDGSGQALANFDGDRDGVPELFLGGQFRAVDGVPSVHIASYAPCGTSGVVVCSGDGTATACPCGNTGANGRGCASSAHPSGARLSNGGIASLANDTLALRADALTGSSAIFVQGSSISGGTGVAFGDGIACAGGTVLRLGSATVVGGAASMPAAGTTIAQLGLVTTPGSTRVYQVLYRDAASFCTSASSNATNGLSLTWSP